MINESNFFLQTTKRHDLNELSTNSSVELELKSIFDTFKNNMSEVIYVVQSYFNIMAHAKTQEACNKIFERNRILAYADSLRGSYENDHARINQAASERAKADIDKGELDNYSILDGVIITLNDLEKDPVIELSNKSTMRQGIVIIWSSIETLIRDIIRVKLNLDYELASNFFESSETNSYWQKKQISFEHLKRYNFDLKNHFGDVALDINSCSNLSAIKTAFAYVMGKNSLSYQNLASKNFYNLYKLRNIIAHKNGIVDDKYKSEVSCTESVGEKVNITSTTFNNCFFTAKDLAINIKNEITGKSVKYDNHL